LHKNPLPDARTPGRGITNHQQQLYHKDKEMEMRLLKLKLRNFKGIRDFTLDCQGGGNVTIYGQNRAGKTTIADAI